ncbi:MAG TPA: A24 family peptidase [Burkholderiales bacterium]|nr:A24 family peptidase [Burkholderiales bacterium]
MAAFGWLAQPAVLPWVALALGLCIGSFLNVVIHRLPKMMEREWREQCAELAGTPAPAAASAHGRYNLLVPRSACPACGHRITALQNIPIVSWLALRGKCAACGTRIAARYPFVELVAGLIGAYAAWRYGATLAALGAAAFGWALLALAVIDLDTQLLPDDITLPLLWAGLLVNFGAVFAPLRTAVIGAVAGYVSLWLVYWAFKLATGKEGMGHGDFKLLAAIGAWLGWQKLPLVILLSSVVGAAVGIALIVLARHGREKPIPFGPYLAAAGLIALFWGDVITRRWLPILG